jgi:hypothetical protein
MCVRHRTITSNSHDERSSCGSERRDVARARRATSESREADIDEAAFATHRSMVFTAFKESRRTKEIGGSFV